MWTHARSAAVPWVGWARGARRRRSQVGPGTGTGAHRAECPGRARIVENFAMSRAVGRFAELYASLAWRAAGPPVPAIRVLDTSNEVMDVGRLRAEPHGLRSSWAYEPRGNVPRHELPGCGLAHQPSVLAAQADEMVGRDRGLMPAVFPDRDIIRRSGSISRRAAGTK